MALELLHDRDEIETFYRGDPALHIYEIGDLDDFFWRHTIWYGLRKSGRLTAVALLYAGLELPALLALSRDPGPLRQLLDACTHLLPHRFYAHLSPGLADALGERYTMEPHGPHRKMALARPEALSEVDVSDVVRLGEADADDLDALYTAAYPGSWFERQMLETGCYVGIRRNGRLVGVAGVHVYSERTRVAALGNIATHPGHRRVGVGRRVTAALCLALRERIDHIGLNVKADNHGAIRLYEELGFDFVAEYEEYVARAR